MTNYKHGHARAGKDSLTYISWMNMVQRCTNQNHPRAKTYGVVPFDPRWLKFENFLEDMGERPSLAFSIERKKNELGYSKDNCVWATSREQANNRTNNKKLVYRGEVLTEAQLLDRFFPGGGARARRRLDRRLAKGWTVEEAVEVPPVGCGYREERGHVL